MTDQPTPPPATEVPSAVTAGILAWLIPGAGHFYIGYNGRALMFLVAVLGLMLFGSALGDWKIVVPPDTQSKDAGAITFRSLAIAIDTDLLWYLIHLGAGLVTLFFTGLNKGLESIAGTTSLVEIGHLYTRVAGMLNILLIVDACSRARAAGAPGPPAPADPPAQPAAPGSTGAAS